MTQGEYLELADKLEQAVDFACASVDLFSGFETVPLETEGDMLAMVAPGAYPVIDSDTARFVRSGYEFDSSAVSDEIEEYTAKHSAALFAKARRTGRPYMTAALARINASWGNLGKRARYAAAKAGLRPPEFNPFANNIAQAVELVDALDRCAGDMSPACSRWLRGVERSRCAYRCARVVASASPRLHVERSSMSSNSMTGGYVVRASIMTPTAQNIANLECDMRALAELLVGEGRGVDDIRLEIEKLVRAYDPCLSCSVH